MSIDLHSHIIPQNVIDELFSHGVKYDAEVQSLDGKPWIVHKQGYKYPLTEQFFKAERKLADMAQMGIDQTVLSPAPPLFAYWLNPSIAGQLARMVNEGCSQFIQENRGKFLGLATIPMQDPKAAMAELEYATTLSGICGIEIGTTIEGRSLDDPIYDDIFAFCERLNWPTFLHPYYVGDKQGMDRYYLTNLIGNPLDTSLAAAALIFGGVLDRYPDLKVILAHGGGYLPYQIGRMDHGYSVRSECKTCKEKPSAYLSRFFYDSITFNPDTLSFLIQFAGKENVVLGTDYPFDMGEYHPIQNLEQAFQNNKNNLEQITLTNAQRLFVF